VKISLEMNGPNSLSKTYIQKVGQRGSLLSFQETICFLLAGLENFVTDKSCAIE